jgi:formate hydrogenlyase subunit 3/multisubunit Na+/H+ antiporter MnhD subunit
MQRWRVVHLYLGCVFAPMLLFFAISGIWQTFGFHSEWLTRLSTIHTSHALKNGSGLSSGLLRIFVLMMALSFIATILLGIVIALRTGRNRKAAFWCLAAGVIVPLVLVLLQAAR